MCGIAGIFNLADDGPVDRMLLSRMATALQHRGPDGEGYHFAPGLGLAHRRLSIIDLGGGAQPMFNEDGSVVVIFNGEIYDHTRLQAELEARGHVFRTRCDTETIVHAWETWHEKCLDHLSGMFAFALWDNNRGQLVLARDRLGKKPLYYTLLPGGTLLFASELCGLQAHPQTPRQLDREAIDDFLAFGYIPDPRSIYAGVSRLPAAHFLLIERRRPLPAPLPYWRPRFAPARLADDDAIAELRRLLRAAVERRLVADVPLGAFLSGGVDSSAVVSVMATLRRDPIATFTIGFDGDDDETGFAQAIAARYRTAHTAERSRIDYIDAAHEQIAVFREPFADSSGIPTLRVSALARRDVTVALSGDGGDEIFAGYRRYRWHLIAEAVRSTVPGPIRHRVFAGLARLYPKLDRAPRWLRAKNTLSEISLDNALGYYRTLARLDEADRRSVMSAGLRGELDGHDPAARISQLMEEAETDDPLAQAQYVDLKTYLPGDILTKVDRASMAVSLEVRAPLLDQAIVEWAGTLAPHQRLRRGQGKYLLKRSLEGAVPADNLYRSKQGFATSLAGQFRGTGAARLRQALLGEAMLDSGYFDGGVIARWIDEHDRGSRDRSAILWPLLVFEAFLARESKSQMQPRAVVLERCNASPSI
jgi:exosortase A-associated amidotransferase 1